MVFLLGIYRLKRVIGVLLVLSMAFFGSFFTVLLLSAGVGAEKTKEVYTYALYIITIDGRLFGGFRIQERKRGRREPVLPPFDAL